jgi:3-hydroxyacyl-CoA dehydrogenase
LLSPYLNEATLALEEGAASAEEIDQAATEFGMPMGPFFLMDMLGIDVCYDVGKYLAEEYGGRMRAAQLFEKLVQAGRIGEKAEAGFYNYGSEDTGAVSKMIADLQAEGKTQQGTEFTIERLIMPLLNEAFLCLQEHIASPNDIDMAMVAGTGMTYHGERLGPLAIADEMGLDHVLASLEQLQTKYGERFRPARVLRTKVRAGHLGKKSGHGFHEYS